MSCRYQQQMIGVLKVKCLNIQGEIRHTTSCACELHGRCLPYWRGPWHFEQQEVEAKLYTLCHHADGSRCPDYQPQEKGYESKLN